MIFISSQPITQARRNYQMFIRVVRMVAFANRTLWDHLVLEVPAKLCRAIDFSDTLLGQLSVRESTLKFTNLVCLISHGGAPS
jgi:hypothetical protein